MSTAPDVIMFQQRPVWSEFYCRQGLKPVQARQPPVILILKVAPVAEAQHLHASQSLNSSTMSV